MTGSERAEHGPLISRHLRRAAILGLATVAATGTALSAGLPAWAVPAEGSIVGSATDAVKDSYIVVLKGGASAQSTGDASKAASAVSASAKALSARFGGKVELEYSTALRGFSVSGLSAAQAKKLAGDPSVDFVAYDSKAKKNGTQTNPDWNLDRIDQKTPPLNNSYTYPNTAANVTVYVVDSGVWHEHPDFEGRASLGPNYASDSSTSTDCDGHGTHVAGSVASKTYGVAKQAKIVSVRVLKCNGEGTAAWSIAAMNYITQNAQKPAVANYSIGFGGVNPAVDAALKASIASGVTWAVAAGNDYQNACNFTPGSVTQALVVGATNEWDEGADFSNYGPCVDLYAPGEAVLSTFFDVYPYYGSAYGSGTSMASPHVAGAAALILSVHTDYNPGQIHNAVVQSSANGVLSAIPGGTPNKLLQIRQTDPPQVAGKTSTLYNPRFGTTEVYARATNGNLIYAYYLNGWSDWINLGGNIQGDPSVFYNSSNGSTEVYVRTDANKVAYRKYINGWTNWAELDGLTVAGSPQVIYNPRFSTTEVYVRTSANKLAFRYFAGGKWSDNWVDLAGELTSDPGLVYNPRFGTTEAYVRNSSGGVEYKYYSNTWSGWVPMGGSVASGANPVVLFNPRFGSTEVYVRNASNTLAYKVYVNGWSDWTTRGGATLDSDPALLYNPNAKTTEVYIRTDAGTIQYQYYLNSWSDWIAFTTKFTGNPAVIFNPRWGTTEVYARNASNGHANYKYYANGWSNWQDISA